MEGMFRYPDIIKITKVIYYEMEFKLPRIFKDATGGIRYYSNWRGWIQIFDEDGNVGEGPAGTTLLKDFVPDLLSEEGKTNGEWIDYFYIKNRNFGYDSPHVATLAGLDLILLDLLASKHQMPLHRFLGATRDWVTVYKGGGSVLLSDEELIDDLLRFKEEGYKTVKFKIGYPGKTKKDFSHDVRRVEKARRALGEGIGIAVDANQAWDADTAIAFAKEAADYNIAFFEEPVNAYRMDELQKLTNAIREAGIHMPVAMGESVRNYQLHVDYVNAGVTHLQPARLYCYAELFRARELAHAHHCDFSTGGSPFYHCAVGPLFEEQEMMEFHEPMNGVVANYCSRIASMKNGRFYMPDEPGAPLRMDFKKIEKDAALRGIRYFYREKKSF